MFAYSVANVHKRIALITGAAKGLGNELCSSFLREGLHVIAGVRDIRSIPLVKEKLEQLGHADQNDFIILPMDVSRVKSISAAASVISDNYPEV